MHGNEFIYLQKCVFQLPGFRGQCLELFSLAAHEFFDALLRQLRGRRELLADHSQETRSQGQPGREHGLQLVLGISGAEIPGKNLQTAQNKRKKNIFI